ncbi:glycosyl transferase [Vibrio sp. qd031]|uniref:glycosyltransferase family 9 protein n=1 Tax=Vibrio sp. qd031 TaxID=1603038 RepID=UPI000A107D7F|nr:glycosyltransferase family 9 protein [Vibrio sp. qd031]ORT51861.1 glycosyl transferase [Vibrio sp. qd031]
MALFSSAPSSLCILRLSAIGDVCNTIAVVQMIQKQWPTTRITWITGKLEAELIRPLPGIDVIEFDKKEGFRAYFKLWKTLSKQRFDALLHCQYALRASVATLGIKARYTLGFDKDRSQDFQTLFTNVKVPSPQDLPHVLDGLLAFAQTLGVTVQEPTWTIPITTADNNWATQHIAEGNKNLVIVPGASKSYKNWTSNGYADVIKHAYNNGWEIILAGSPSQVEVDLANNIMEQIDTPIRNLVGESSLMEMLSLIKQADLVIAPDTGPVHMANAVKTPVIGLYAHHNPERTGPYHFRKHVVSVYKEALDAERGQSTVQWRTRVKDKSAMERIQSSQVIDMFDTVTSSLT